MSTDSRVLNASAQLSDEFPFNLDVNSGNPLGLSKFNIVVLSIIECSQLDFTRLVADHGTYSRTSCFSDYSLISYHAQISDGARSSSARDYIAPVLSRSNLDVVVNTQVTKIVQTGTLNGLPVFSGVEFAQSASSMCFPIFSRTMLYSIRTY